MCEIPAPMVVENWFPV